MHTTRSDTCPQVTVVMPILNEADFIEECLLSVLLQQYPPTKLEIIVADGMSSDGTRDIVARYVAGYRPDAVIQTHQEYASEERLDAHPIRMIDNPKQIVSSALNGAIQVATGDIIVRIDGHTVIEPDYVQACVNALLRTNAAGVGGPMISIGKGYLAEAIALASATPFGIGNSAYRTSRYFKEQQVETTHMGAYWRDVLLDVGLFNEYFVRHQDYELDYRIRKNGGIIVLDPSIHSHYYVRANLVKLWRQYVQYGFWKGRFLYVEPTSLRWRHLIPPLFVLALIGLSLGVLLNVDLALPLLAIMSGAYVAFLIVGSLITCRIENIRYFPVLPLVFFCLHFSWGLGVWFGLLLPEALSPRHWRR